MDKVPPEIIEEIQRLATEYQKCIRVEFTIIKVDYEDFYEVTCLVLDPSLRNTSKSGKALNIINNIRVNLATKLIGEIISRTNENKGEHSIYMRVSTKRYKNVKDIKNVVNDIIMPSVASKFKLDLREPFDNITTQSINTIAVKRDKITMKYNLCTDDLNDISFDILMMKNFPLSRLLRQ